MINQLRRTSPGLEFLFGALAFSTLTVGCGESGELPDNNENVVEVAQGLTTVVLRAGAPGVTMEDTYITQTSLTQTAGNADQLYVNTNVSGSRNVVGLLAWDLSSIPHGSTISAATLKITTNQSKGQAPEVHRVTRAWTAATATWNSMGNGYDPEIIAQFSPFTATSRYESKTQDITSLVQDWVSGDYPNNGLALVGAPTPNLQGAFYSSEVNVAAYAPELTVIFEPPFCFGKTNGTVCNDNDSCTQTDTCQTGQCVGSNPVVCASNTPCSANACNSATGTCSATALPDGSACNDGNLCTQSSRCFSGLCIGENPISCQGLDPCTSGSVCQPATGNCTGGTPITPDVQTGLTYRWTFNEPSGTTVDVVSAANGNPSTYLSRTPSFDGTSALTALSAGTIAEDTTLLLPATLNHPEYTFSAWVWNPNGPAPNNTAFMTLGGFVGPSVTGTLLTTGIMRWYTAQSNGPAIHFDSPSPMNDGVWHHHVITGSNSGFATYVDGRSTGEFASTNISKPSNFIRLNAYPGRQVKLEDVRYYNRAFTACDVFNLSKAPTDPCGLNPVALWKGEDSLVDAIGTNNGVSGTLNGATPVTFGNGKYSRAFNLNGTSYIEVPNAANLQITGSISMSAWVYINTAGGRILDKNTAGQPDGYMLDTLSGRLRMIVGPTIIWSTTQLPTARWVHVAGTWDGTSGKLYVDGALVFSANPPSPPPIPINNLPLRIGADSTGNNRLNGLLDEVAIHNTTLSAEQVVNMAQRPPTTLPVGWWRAESDMNDASGNENNGASGTGAGITAVTYGTGKVSNAFSLPGTSFVQVPNSTSLQVTGSLTVSAWIKITTAGGRIIDKVAVGGANGYLFDTINGKLRLIAGPQQLTSPNNLPLNVWTHVAGTWDGTSVKLFVDGVQVATSTPATPMPIPSNTLTLRIGADANGGSLFNGLIDQAAVHNVALTPVQIQAMAVQIAPPAFVSSCPGVIAGRLASFDASAVNGAGTPPADYAVLSQWTNLVTTKHAVQTTEARKPKFKLAAINRKPAVQFDGVDDVLSLPLDINYTSYPNLTVVAVFQNAAGTPPAQTYAGVWGHDNSGFDRFLLSGGNGGFQKGISNGAAVLGVPGITTESAPLIVITTLRNGGAANSSTVHLNGTQVLTFAESHANSGSTSMSIGNIEGPPGSTGLSFDGFISVIEVYDHALNTSERDAVYAKLAALYL